SLSAMREHLSEVAMRLSRVEGRVTLISERLGLDALGVRPVAGEPSEVSESQLQAEAAGYSLTGEALTTAVQRPSPASKPVSTDDVAGNEVGESLNAVVRSNDEAPSVAPTGCGIGAARPDEADRRAEAMPSPAARPAQPPPKPPQPGRVTERMRDWEQSLPGNWLSRIGILALFIGLGFLTHWAVVNDKLVRVPLLLVGLACGGVLLMAGHHWRKAYRAWAQALTGGGIGVLYLSVFGSYALYDAPVMPFYATFGLMFLVTIVAVGIALRRESMAIAILGIVGAFLVPIILRASDLCRGGHVATETVPGLMIAYILVLDAGIVGLSMVRKWRWFTILGFGGSLAVYGLWYATSGHDGPVSTAEWSLTGIFLCFAAATTLFHVVWRRVPELTDLGLMSANAAVYFCVSYGLLWDGYRGWLGLFSAGLAGLYALTGYLAWRRSHENRRLSLFAFGIAIVFLTVAIPVQLHRSQASWITVAWAAEGAALVWIAVRQKMPMWQVWGLGAFCLALVGLFAYNRAIDAEQFRPFMNDTFWAFGASILAFYAAAYLLRRKEVALQPWFFPAMMLTASLLTLWLFSGEIISFAGSRIMEARSSGATYAEVRGIENARALGLVGLWIAYGLCALFVGTRRDWIWLRSASYGLVTVACCVTVMLLNHSHAMVRIGESRPLVNYALGSFALCTGALYLFARIVSENRERLGRIDRAARLGAMATASALTLWALSAEITTFLAGSENLRSIMLVAL
ncbi:MAG: DUF2339 domain-containing protein, partial [Dehalococcoidia bacterium]|nr:DUF2339 domain-containing protein [Dehalococcoidia bacterium]